MAQAPLVPRANMEEADVTWLNAKTSFIRHAKLSENDRRKIENCSTPADVARWTAEEYHRQFPQKKALLNNEAGRFLCLNAMQAALGSDDAPTDVAQPCPLLSSILDRIDKVGRCLDIASNVNFCPLLSSCYLILIRIFLLRIMQSAPFASVAWAGLKYFVMVWL